CGGTLVVREKVPEEGDACRDAVEGMIREGASVIYLTSFGYGNYVDEIAAEHPRVAFFCVSGQGTAKNCTSYFARLYQARYLSGIVAGAASRTGVLGYVASMPNSHTNRGINAYAMGIRLANPNAKLMVRFTGSWNDEEEERKSVALLADRGADVISYHADRPYAIREAEALGLFSIGYGDLYEEYSDRFLTSVVYDWKVVYEEVLGDYASGRANLSRGYWLDMSQGSVRLHKPSPLVASQTADLVNEERLRIMTNQDVFSGKIYDNEGRLRCEDGERISDRQLFNDMDWFVEGVEIYE
ncbi:MAG: BMP family ABC transporter substrate-binding protein, partial [Selenomonadaceae bacterium]|nr:BMP family ABC transporter substrate-binding protein [Selenomonadaceae bacterium]